MEIDRMERFAASLDDRPGTAIRGTGVRPPGRVSWAWDGATALALHGWAAIEQDLCLVLEWGEAAQFWLRAVGAWPAGAEAHRWTGWLDTDLEGAQRVLHGWGTFTQLGQVTIRVVSALERPLMMTPAEGHEPVPVLGQDEVERAHPDHAQLLARVRELRSLGRLEVLAPS